MIEVQIPSENVEIDDDYSLLAEWMDHHNIDLIDVDYIDLDTVKFTFADEAQAALFKLAWA